jgi:hypothetical protein
MPEKELLELFDLSVGNILAVSGTVMWGGFNHRQFDLPWIWHKALKYDCPTLIDFIPREKYSKGVLDVRELWTGGFDFGKGGLKDIARFLGYNTRGMTGADVLPLYLAGEYDKIREYCIDDVELTRQICWRMGKGNPPMMDTPA